MFRRSILTVLMIEHVADILGLGVQKHKANKEMMPKAAFQFGVKTSDGRRGPKQMGKAVEQKEQKQYKQIKNLLKQNHGEQYSAAFTDNAGKQSKDGGPSKRRRI